MRCAPTKPAAAAAAAALAAFAFAAHAAPAHAQANVGPIGSLTYLGQTSFATGTQFGGTTVGGLSGLTYDSANNRFYAIADDRTPGARFYTLTVNLGDGALNDGDVTFTGVTTITQPGGAAFPNNGLDPEGIALSPDGQNVYISSEGDKNFAGGPLQPFVNRFSLATGQQNQSLGVPAKFAMTPPANETQGPRNNLAFESLAFTPDGQTLVTATENALYQDGPSATTSLTSPARILTYNVATGQPGAEYRYDVDRVQVPGVGFQTNGLTDILFTGPDTFLAIERSFTDVDGSALTPDGNQIRIYQCSLAGATDISGIPSLTGFAGAVTGVQKTLLLNLVDLGIPLDNLEGLAFGPRLADGSLSLIVVSDNNFSATQATQFIAFRVNVAAVPEPGTLALAGLGLLPLAGMLVAKRRKGAASR